MDLNLETRFVGARATAALTGPATFMPDWYGTTWNFLYDVPYKLVCSRFTLSSHGYADPMPTYGLGPRGVVGASADELCRDAAAFCCKLPCASVEVASVALLGVPSPEHAGTGVCGAALLVLEW